MTVSKTLQYYSITYAGKCQMVDKFNNGLGQVLFHGIDNGTIR